ncbi:MAG: ABC transporter substrate-binding protein [Planctomycetota bacterium]|jgi:iron(III) transport system substrate-binding protein
MAKTLLFAVWLCCLQACGSKADVTLYVALDQEHSGRLIQAFEKRSGLKINPRFDTEAQKTVGLVSAIVEEAARPRCDVFWNNELAQTVRLAQKDLLQAYDSPAAEGIPAQYRDAEHRWTGFAARARILIVNKDRIKDPKDYPQSMWDLLDPKWRGQCGVARPKTGTTLTHFTALRFVLGEQEFKRFLDGLFENQVKFLMSNGATMRETASGKLAWAFTDTDDFHVALKKGHPVAAVFPDQGQDQVGTMLIPNSVAIVKNAPHAETARRVVDWILSEQLEATLAAAKSAQIPLRASVKGPAEPSILAIGKFKQMQWDPEVTAANLEKMLAEFSRRFGR